jgi:hypothetical protein
MGPMVLKECNNAVIVALCADGGDNLQDHSACCRAVCKWWALFCFECVLHTFVPATFSSEATSVDPGLMIILRKPKMKTVSCLVKY